MWPHGTSVQNIDSTGLRGLVDAFGGLWEWFAEENALLMYTEDPGWLC